MEQRYLIFNLEMRKYLMGGQLGYSDYPKHAAPFGPGVATGICIRANQERIVEVMIPLDSMPRASFVEESEDVIRLAMNADGIKTVKKAE